MAGSNFKDEILAAMMEQMGKRQPSAQGTANPVMQYSSPIPEEDEYARFLAMLEARASAQENETVPEGQPRLTDPLDRARYPGS